MIVGAALISLLFLGKIEGVSIPPGFIFSIAIVVMISGFAWLLYEGKKSIPAYAVTTLAIAATFAVAAADLDKNSFRFAVFLIFAITPYAIFTLVVFSAFSNGPVDNLLIGHTNRGVRSTTSAVYCLNCGDDVLGDIEWCDDCLNEHDKGDHNQ